MVIRFQITGDEMTTPETAIRNTVEFVHVGKYAVEVPVRLIDEEGGWSPYLTREDAKRLEDVRLALRRGDIETAARHGRVFQLLAASA
jgi:hypothetical protein